MSTIKITPIVDTYDVSDLEMLAPDLSPEFAEAIQTASADGLIHMNNCNGIITVYCHATAELVAQMNLNRDQDNRDAKRYAIDKMVFHMRNGLWDNCHYTPFAITGGKVCDGGQRSIALGEVGLDMSKTVLDIRIGVPESMLAHRGEGLATTQTIVNELQMFAGIGTSSTCGTVKSFGRYWKDFLDRTHHALDIHMEMSLIEACGTVVEDNAKIRNLTGRERTDTVMWYARKYKNLQPPYRITSALAAMTFYASTSNAAHEEMREVLRKISCNQRQPADHPMGRMFDRAERMLENKKYEGKVSKMYQNDVFHMACNALHALASDKERYNPLDTSSTGVKWLSTKLARKKKVFAQKRISPSLIEDFKRARGLRVLGS